MKNKKLRGSAILTTVFLLFGILAVTLIGLEIIMSGLAARRAQGSSAKAFWAAEAGIERAAMAFKNDRASNNLFANCLENGADTSVDGAYLRFCSEADCENTDPSETRCSSTISPNNKAIYHLGGNLTMSSYWVKVKIDGRNIALTSQGNFLSTSRQIYVKFCSPYCPTGAVDDGCGGTCQ